MGAAGTGTVPRADAATPVGHGIGATRAWRRGRARSSATGAVRLPALDGLRALAVLLVLGFHFGVPGMTGGYFGVDVFYVLSGFLITGLLVGERERTGRIRLGAFWLRRARRLVPALLVVVVAVVLMVRFAMPPGYFGDMRASALSALFYVSNWWQIAASSNYFVASAPASPLTHTWSLAIEEQFYLVWPFVVLLALRLGRDTVRGIRILLAISVAGAVGSAVEMAALYRPVGSTTRIYFGTDTHAQSVLVGAALACVLLLAQRRRGLAGMDPTAASRRWRAVATVAGVGGVGGILALSRWVPGTSAVAYRGGFLVAGGCTAAVITAAVVVPRGPLSRLLSVRPAVALGTVSYGVYLWHYPVAVFVDAARTGLVGPALLTVRVGATLALATVSWFVVERPVLTGALWRTARAVAPAVAASGLTVAVVVAAVPAAAAAGLPQGLRGSRRMAAMEQAVQVHSFAGAGTRVRVLIVGDSVALTVAVGMAPYAASYGVDLGGRSHTGCGVALALPLDDHGVVGDPFPNCPTWPTWWSQDIKQLHPQVVGLVIGFWEVVDRWYQGKWQHLGDPAFDAYETSMLERAVRILGSGGAKVALFTAPYFHTGEQPDGAPWPQDNPARVDELNRIIDAVAARHPGSVAVVPLNKVLDPAGHFTWTIDGKVVRQGDGVHTTVAAGAILAKGILPELATLGRGT